MGTRHTLTAQKENEMEFKNMEINRVRFEKEEDLHLVVISAIAGLFGISAAAYLIMIILWS